tara:strand:- start:453 stop:752 length:300 start_codon:yes stop_codon:yes gene_type:complete
MIQAHNPMIIGDAKNVAVTFQNGQRVVSLALDNSAGRMKMLMRGDIRLLIEDESGCKDVTVLVFPKADVQNIRADLSNFELAMNWLKRCTWGLEGRISL